MHFGSTDFKSISNYFKKRKTVMQTEFIRIFTGELLLIEKNEKNLNFQE